MAWGVCFEAGCVQRRALRQPTEDHLNRPGLLFAAVFSLLIAACQCGTPPGDPDGGGGGAGGSGGTGGGTGGAGGGGDAPDASIFLPDGGLTCAPVRDACGTGCCPGLACQNGTCQVPQNNPCGLNALFCSGQCTVVINDPNNCGVCGRVCGANTVCLRGDCLPPSECPAGLTACQGRCVDLQTSNAFCGTCSTTSACAAGTGCSRGSCVPVVPLDGGGPACLGGGPPVQVTSDAGTACSGNLAQVSFRWSVCSCTTIAASSELKTDGFSSTTGSLDAGLLGAGVAANQGFSASSVWDVGGTAWFGGGMNTARGTVRQRYYARGSTSGGGTEVKSDAWIQGSVQNLTVRGILSVTDAGAVGANVIADGGIQVAAFTVDDPCECSPSQLIDVAGIVANGVANNDNATIGLDPAVFDNAGNNLRLDLPCGRYSLTRIQPNGPVTIAVHGRTALFIAGDVDLSNTFDIAIDPNAELDIFIGGNLAASSAVTFGNLEAPAQLRIYVAGNSVSTSAQSRIAGNYYLPAAAYQPTAAVDLYGSVFARSVSPSARFSVHYDQAILSAGGACNPPPDAGVLPDGGSAPDAGAPLCGTCRDCGNQACVAGRCGACTSDGQCCAPLTCQAGQCLPQIN